MKVRRRQQFTVSILQPLFPLESATIRAMPIATAMILMMYVIAMTTSIDMFAYARRVAIRQSSQYFLAVWVELSSGWMIKDFSL